MDGPRQAWAISCIGEPTAEIEDAIADEVPIAFGRQVLRLAWPELSGTWDECCAESRSLCKREIAVVSRSEHHLAWIKPQDPRHALVRLQGRLVGAGRVGADDYGPGQFRP
jgi:hypothetical protein